MPNLIKFIHDNDEQGFDLVSASDGSISQDAGWESCVFISWFSDKRDFDEDLLRDSRGWWADSYVSVANENFGSGLWKYRRSKITQGTLAGLRFELTSALQWMVDDGIAASVEVETERLSTYVIKATANITQLDGGLYSSVWSVHLARL